MRGVNQSVITVRGKVFERIAFENSDNKAGFVAELFVVDDKTMRFDLLLDRKFFDESKLKLTYFEGKYSVVLGSGGEVNELLPIFAIEALEKSKRDIVLEGTDKCVPQVYKDKLIEVFDRANRLKVAPVEDNYCARILLRDESLFRYTPRRFSVLEKRQLKEITDDLLERGIIEPNVSPYCSRVVLVTKRSGQKRMCIDLHALNQRIFPQVYPFPIIEDQLSLLHGKGVFTKLDMKEEFHQIAVYPECTKYFAFATHSGQFEFVKLSVGFSDAPAEFQKRIISVLQDLIRVGKVLVYIDDLLIATVTIEENLEILEEVLILLKRHKLELNLAKCSFLRKEIEYLGYWMSEGGISFCQRHVEAVLNYPPPTNVRQLQGFLGLCNYFRKFIRDCALCKDEKLARFIKEKR